MEKQKRTREDLVIQEGKITVNFIEVDGKKIVLIPVPHSDIRNHLTHENCENCKKEFEKKFTYERFCHDCQNKKDEENFLHMKLVEWDKETPLYLYDSTDKYFFDYDDILDYCKEEEIELNDLKLVLCSRSYFSPIDLEYITEEVTHEDWEPSEEFNNKLKDFNDWLVKQNTNTWFPTDQRVDLSSYETK
ncbi:hypothetical protein PFY12_14620 [Chryseobacterium camelliae]|uniref:Uncharacterized protein n=1 Tax=Chryseobacterium camelliae TaxID=1265445 RepID=A0ABY7QKT4_9FLAO|nr:hypothetical protein [Chryseobacterium camelliae]WBV60259.1 hypothetical protein PFY12_14620 [Chryseobacterium camelliae]